MNIELRLQKAVSSLEDSVGEREPRILPSSRRVMFVRVAFAALMIGLTALVAIPAIRNSSITKIGTADKPEKRDDGGSQEDTGLPEGNAPRSEPAATEQQKGQKAGGRPATGEASKGGAGAPLSDQDLIAFSRGSTIQFVLADGSGLKQLTQGVAPSWSFDGKRFAFTSSENIHVMNADGSGRRSLDRSGRLPVWSPNGSQIAFNWPDDTSKPGCHPEWEGTGGSGPECGIGIINADGSNPRWLGTGRWPDWGPDGRIVFADGAPSEPCHYSDTYTYSQAVLETSSRTRLPACALPLWVMNADGSGRALLAANKAIRPSWSPDGKRIAYYTEAEGSFVLNADGSAPQSIAPAGFMDPSWFPNGLTLAYTHQQGEGTSSFKWSIQVRSLDGQLSKQLTFGSADTLPSVAPAR